MRLNAVPEVWLRGPIPAISAYLQPVAHSLLQCKEEVLATLSSLTETQIWSRPAEAASVGFHLRHAIGSLDRLFTYARGEQLSKSQLEQLASEADSGTVSYTHLTLPTNREVSISVVAVSLK